MIFLTLINNIAILIALSVIYSFISRKWDFNTISHQVWSGILFSAVAIIGMMNPLILAPGIIFDGRSIIISVAGLFGGPISATITVIISIGYRFYIGGSGIYMGVSVILSSALIGVLYHHLRIKEPNFVRPFYLWIFGMIVHICMLICTFALPSDVRYQIFIQILFPVLIIYPIGSLLVCLLFLNHEDQIKSEEALRRSEKQLNEIKNHFEIALQATNSSTFDFSIITQRLDSTPFLYLHLGYKLSEIPQILQNIQDVIHPDDLPKLASSFGKYLEERTPLLYSEFRIKSKDNEWIWCNAVGKITEKGVDGKPVKILGIMSEISDKKRLEDERIRLQNLESLGVLAGGIAHDFNNILTSIMGHASLALVDLQESQLKKIISSIVNASKRAVSLTQQLLTFAKGGIPQKQILIIEKTIEDTTKFSLSGSNVECFFNFQNSLLVEADPGQISQVIQNIVINAKQSMPSGGKIEIKTREVIGSDGIPSVKISITDSGTGIPFEYLSKIFDPYFTTKSSGSGLGLSVSHSIIKKHGGKIDVQSSNKGGTTFEIVLPASGQNFNNLLDNDKVTVKKLKILLMDDDEDVRELLSAMLEKLGHSVICAKDGSEAIKAFEFSLNNHEYFDIVFLDLTIKGGLGGIDTLKILKNINIKSKFIVSSGYADKPSSDYIELGFDEKLDKPYTIDELNKIIFNIIP